MNIALSEGGQLTQVGRQVFEFLPWMMLWLAVSASLGDMCFKTATLNPNPNPTRYTTRYTSPSRIKSGSNSV